MRVMVETKEVAEEGFMALLDKDIEVFCGIYIYAGKLIGVNDKYIKLSNPHLVYETGGFLDKEYKDAQPMGREFHYLSMGFIESYGESHKLA